MRTIAHEYSKDWVPISRAVDMAHIDDYDDAQVMRQRFNNWAIRGYKQLRLNLLRKSKSYMLPINLNTNTAKLPDEYKDWLEVGFYDSCGEFRWMQHTGLAENEIAPKCTCPACSSTNGLCDAVKYNVVTEQVFITDTWYTKTTTQSVNQVTGKLINQILEPVFNQVTGMIEMQTHTEDVCEIDLLPCGCIDPSDKNRQVLYNCGCCWGLNSYLYGNYGYNAGYGRYFMGCHDESFAIDEENRLMHIYAPNVLKVFLRATTDMPTRNGVVYIPEVACETIAAFILFKQDQRRKSVTLQQKQMSYLNYKRERTILRKVMIQIRMQIVRNALNLVPNG